MQPGDTILGLDLAHGGHLTHGMRLNFSGKYFQCRQLRRAPDTTTGSTTTTSPPKAREHKPKLVIAGASAYPRHRLRQVRRRSAEEVGGCSWSTWPTSPAWSRRSCTRTRCRIAEFVTVDHATRRCAGRAAGFILCKEDWAQKINSAVFPGVQGGPLMHVIAAKAVAFGEALQPELPDVHRPGHRQREGAGRGTGCGPASRSSPAAPTTT